jgi:hypothetical protein
MTPNPFRTLSVDFSDFPDLDESVSGTTLDPGTGRKKPLLGAGDSFSGGSL